MIAGEAERGSSTISLRDIYRARKTIRPWVSRTPLMASPSLSKRTGARVYLKLETVHDIGAFKIRGATNCILQLDKAEQARGVVTVSTGNHGRAVARAAQQVGAKAVVCMSGLVPRNKREAIAALGAEVCIVGRSQDEAEVEARRLVAEEGMSLVHPFDDPHVIAGQGTIGLELLEDLPRVDTVLVGLSGGGLISGIAIAIKAADPCARVIGISMERGPAMVRSLEAGEPVLVEEEASLADSLGGGIGLDNRHTFDLVRRLVDGTVLVSESQIADGMRYLYREEGIVAEGGGAVGVSALLHGLVHPLGSHIAIVISGRNVDIDTFSDLMQTT